MSQSGQLEQVQDDLEKLKKQLSQEKEGRELETKARANCQNAIVELKDKLAVKDNELKEKIWSAKLLNTEKQKTEVELNRQLEKTLDELEKQNQENQKIKTEINNIRQKITKGTTSPSRTKEGIKDVLTLLISLFSLSKNEEREKEIEKLKEQIEQEKSNHQAWQKKYEENLNNFKEELDKEKAAHQSTKNELATTEQQIIQQLNTILKLNLQNPTLRQVITRIQELINKDPLIDENIKKELATAQATIIQLQKQLSEKPDAPFGEDLAIIKETDLQSLEKLFPNQLDNKFREQIRQAANYQQLATARQNFIQKHISKNLDEQQLINSPQTNQQFSKERFV